ncbi:MAG: two-component system, OmpR family, sensor kinase [Micromonosporaceae bacterium]|nr:two-component system, OmpR family, sensor kinase [Micromonosporaceae bacterium]
MWATPSPSTNRLLVVGWAVFAGLNVVGMYLLPGQETIPFHFVWISLALVYGFTSWRTSWMVIALAGVVLTTGPILAHHAQTGVIRWEETTEEPLMATLFGVMVWHVHRRQILLREVQRINERQRRRHETQQLFVRLASHELRTPVTVARGYTELLRVAHQESAILQDTEVILEELDKLSRITQRLVTLMQVDQPHPVRRCAVDAELTRIVRRWQPTADRDWVVHSEIGYGLVNPERFEAALDCLLENAVKFTGPGDRIEVTGELSAHEWRVRVRDTGSGMSSETAEHLLTRPPGRGTGTGSGLGLAIVRAVVESLGGEIMVSGEPNRGTTVTLRIPRPQRMTVDQARATDPVITEPAAAPGG